jgi:hypothetical protein
MRAIEGPCVVIICREAMLVEMITTGQQVQTGSQHRDCADKRQQQLGSRSLEKTHKGRYLQGNLNSGPTSTDYHQRNLICQSRCDLNIRTI